MEANIVYVVGDGFLSFSKNANVISLSGFKEMILLPRIGKARNGFYILGQGIAKQKIDEIKTLIKKNKITDIVIKEHHNEKEENKYVHKKVSENVMISKPIVIRDNLFFSQLMIDDRCSEMSDHMTGQHVQGMVLIEAARQMALSVSENFLLSESERFNSYFILSNMDAQFKQFLFPTDVELQCALIRCEKISSGKFSADFVITFTQNNVVCMEVMIGLMADEKTALEKKESRLANFSLKMAVAKQEENLTGFCNELEAIGEK